ncbi:MAG: germination protein YpeB [Clostridiaceae bacterium]|nr:germination protein YpeB [Clostridiaceae bacterium]
MSIRDKLLDFKRRLSDRHMYSIVLVTAAVIAGAGIYQYKRALEYRNYVENQYNRPFHELVGYVEDIEVSLEKGMLVNSPRQMAVLSSEIWRKAAFAQANLGQLPISHVQLDKTSKFLAQVGDYTYSLSKKAMDGIEITDKEYAQLEKLQKYSKSLSEGLANMQKELYNGTIRFGELKQKGNRFFQKEAKNIAVTHMENIEKEFQEYPSLIYDGPFSDHIDRIEPRMLKGGKELTEEQAKEKAIAFLGKEKAKNIEYTGESNGSIPAYTFTVKTDTESGKKGSERSITLAVTKVNGYILWMLDNKNVTDTNLDIDQAKQRVKEFLDSKGFPNMKESYYLRNNGVATINYAYVQDEIVMYPDLIKVKVALDNGEIVGFESQGYLMTHQDKRELPAIKISEEEAREKINPRLKIESTRLAVIPLESKREVLCYEFQGKFNDRDFLIYINAETGKEEEILMLMETPNGVLTM